MTKPNPPGTPRLYYTQELLNEFCKKIVLLLIILMVK